MHDSTDTIIAPGGKIKATATEEGARLAGYLVRFSDAEVTDLEDDFFTPETDFGPFRKSVVLYAHGMDAAMKRRVLDDAATLEVDDAGVWIETQLALRDDYEEMIFELAEEGKLGWSSGTARHLVETKQVATATGDARSNRSESSGSQGSPAGVATQITRWPLGLDASLTPMPAEPRNQAVPLKSWQLPDLKSLRLTSNGAKAPAILADSGLIDSAMKAQSLNDRLRQISVDFRAQFKGQTDFYPHIEEVFADYLIVEVNGLYYRVAYEEGEGRHVFAARQDWTEVEEDSRWVARKAAKKLKYLNNLFSNRRQPVSGLAHTIASINNELEGFHHA